ncbi:hypothetical protein MIR68_011708 [Amoeboaphelidium protococcarum]|nr:hypothetical protein MIR68_011708 [Amoeboaphelidium protococcarum]
MSVIYQLAQYLWNIYQSLPLGPLKPFLDTLLLLRLYARPALQLDNPSPFTGGYNEAIQKCKSDLKFLFILFHNDSVDSSQKCLQLFSKLPDKFNSDEVLMMVVDAGTGQGWMIAEQLQIEAYPCITCVAYIENKVQILRKLDYSHHDDDKDVVTAEWMQREIQSAVEEFSPFMVVARQQLQARQVERQLREEQEQAYERSLRIDREKERVRRESERMEQEKEKEKSETLRRRRLISETVSDEPSADNPDAIRILLRLPSGAKQSRRFNRNSLIKEIHNYAISLHLDNVQELQVVSPFPRRVFDINATIKDHIKENEVVVIEEVYKED